MSGSPAKEGDASRLRFDDASFRRDRELRVLRALYRRVFHDVAYSDADRKDLEDVVCASEEVAPGDGEARGAADKLKQAARKQALLPKSLLLVRGESGMGKSRLVEAFRASLQVPAFTVTCYEVEGLPIKPVLRVVQSLLAESEHREALLEKYRYGLEVVLPQLFGGGDDALPAIDAREKLKVFDCLTQLVIEIAVRRPVVLLIEDLHWGDRATIDLLRYIGRNVQLRNARANGEAERADDDGAWRTISPRQAPPREFVTQGLEDGIAPRPSEGKARLLILATYRPFAATGHYIEEAIRSLRAEPFALHLALRPLEEDEAEGLARAAFGSRGATQEVVDRARALSRGNPLSIAEMAEWLAETGVLGSGRAGEVTLEELAEFSPLWRSEAADHAGFIRERLARLSGDALALAQLLALVRKPAGPTFLAEVLAWDREAVDRALEELARRGLAEPAPGEMQGAFTLCHWEHLQAIRQDTPPARRLDLHDRIARALQRRVGGGGARSAYEIFYHRKRGRDPAAAVPRGRAAAEWLARAFCGEKAVMTYLEVLEIIPEEGDVEARCEILERIAELERDAGRIDRAKHNFKKLFDVARDRLGPERTADLLLRFSELYRAQGRWSRTQKILNRALRLLRDGRSPTVARIHERIASLRLAKGDVKRALDFSSKGLRAVEGLDQRPEAIPIRRTMALAYLRKGNAAQAADCFHRSLEIAERLGARAAIPEILDELGRVYLERGNFFRAARYFYRSLEYRARARDLAGLPASYDELGRIYQLTGDPYKAIEHLCRSLEIRERTGDRSGLTPTLTRLGRLYTQMGQYQAAIRCLKRGIENAEALGDTRALVACFVELARVYYRLGEVRQVGSLVTQVRILAEEFRLGPQLAAGERLAGRVAVVGREWATAEKAFRRALELIGRSGLRREEAEVKLDLAELEYERENYESAAKLASQAGAVADELRAPALQARSLWLKGNVHRFLRGGNPDRAREYLQRSLEVARSVNDLHLLYDITYALAKVFHYGRRFGEARAHYGKAEAILRRIGDGLPEAMAQRFYEDKRRKLFFEDFARFRQEAGGRGQAALDARPAAAPTPAASPLGAAEYRYLLEHLGQLQRGVREDDFPARLLGIGLDLVRAERGFLLRVDEGRQSVAACRGIQPEALRSPAFRGWEALAREVVRRATPLRTTGAEELETFGALAAHGGLRERGALVVPIAIDGQVLGAIYADRAGEFETSEEELLAMYARHAAVALGNHLALRALERDPRTGLLLEAGFLERLDRMLEAHRSRGRPFALVGAVADGLGDRLEAVRALGLHARDDALIRCVSEALGEDAVAGLLEGCWIVAALSGASAEEGARRAASLEEALGLLGSAEAPIAVETVVLVPGSEPVDVSALFEALRGRMKAVRDRLLRARAPRPGEASERQPVAFAFRRDRFEGPGGGSWAGPAR